MRVRQLQKEEILRRGQRRPSRSSGDASVRDIRRAGRAGQCALTTPKPGGESDPRNTQKPQNIASIGVCHTGPTRPGQNRSANFRVGSSRRFSGTICLFRSLGCSLTAGSARSSRLFVVPRLRSDHEDCYVAEMPREPVNSEPPFAEQLLRQAGTLYNFARYLCRDAAMAEDLLQDTFARALDAQMQFSPGSNLKAWLFRILRNAYVDGRRRARRSPVTLGADDDEREPANADVWLRGDIEIDRLRGLVARDIEAALSRLSDDARAVILLDLEGCTETEIASVMDVAVGTVKSRLARARAVLREQLQEYAP